MAFRDNDIEMNQNSETKFSPEHVESFIGGTTQLGAGIVRGVAESKAMERARSESKGLYEQQMELSNQSFTQDTKLRSKEIKQRFKSFEQEKRKYKIDRDFDMFQRAIEKRINNQQTVMNSFNRLNSLAVNNIGVRNMLKDWSRI